MQQFLAIIALINQLLPLIRETVKTLEALFPQSGTGASKKEMLMQILSNAAEQSGTLKATYEAAKPTLMAIIDTVAKLHKSPEVNNPAVAAPK